MGRMPSAEWWRFSQPDGPIVATAIHCGHDLRADLAPYMNLTEKQRAREEDSYTDQWRFIAPTRVICRHSRFGLDLNRPAGKSVYRGPEEAWGLQVWRDELPKTAIDRSLALHREFYRDLERLLRTIERRHRAFVVLDLHSYNHRRAGPTAPPADPDANPEINIGTGTMDREYWAPVVERCLKESRRFNFLGRHLDVRENVRFYGGEFPAWVHRTFPRTGCALAIEVKKFFMDEWTGAVDPCQLAAIRQMLASLVPPLVEELGAFARRKAAA